MTDGWTERLSDYIDGELSDADSDSVQRHVAICEECRTTVDQLRAVRARASELDDRAPEVDLWGGIVSRIKGATAESHDVVDLPQRLRSRRRISFSVPQLLVAGIALMFVSAGTVWMALSGDSPVSEPIAADEQMIGESEALLASFDDPGYDAAVAELERLLDAGRDRLDPATVEVLEQSLTTIDTAIREARDALRSDPTNFYLSEHLSATMNQKVRLLRQAVRLATAAS